MPTAHLIFGLFQRSAGDDFKQSVPRPHIPQPVCFDDDARPGATDAGINDTQKYRSRWKFKRISRKKITCRLFILAGRIGEEIDNLNFRRVT